MQNTILVTGSSRGLGLEIANNLLQNKFRVIINGRDKQKLNIIKQESEYSNFLYCFNCDITKNNSIKKLKNFTKKNDLFITKVVHNLGGKIENDIQPLALNILHKSMKLNLESSIKINNYLIPKMIKNGGGQIIHIGSSSGYTGNAAPAYSISKGALNTYVKNSARYYAKDSIMMCVVVPSIIEHPGSEWYNKKKFEPKKYKNRKSQMPLGKFAKPSDIAPYVTMLCKIDSMQVTGSIINLTAGV